MTEIESKVRKYMLASAGTANQPSDHTIRCFIGMIETGEADVALFRRVGGEWLVNRIRTFAKEIGSVVE